MVQRRQREASEAVEGIATGVSLLPQTVESQWAPSLLRDLVRSGLGGGESLPSQPAPRRVQQQHRAERAGHRRRRWRRPRASGSTLLGRLRGHQPDADRRAGALLGRRPDPSYHVYLKALYGLYHTDVRAPDLVPQRTEELANFQLDAVRRGLAMIEAHGGLLRRRCRRSGQDLRQRVAEPQLAEQLPARRPAPDPLPCRSQAHMGSVQRTVRLGCRGDFSQHDRGAAGP